MGFFSKLFGLRTEEPVLPPSPQRISKGKEYGRHNIVGVTFENMDGTKRQANIKKCIRITNGAQGHDHEVWYSAEFEPDNRHDPMAIVVSAEERWYTKNDESREKLIGILGYIPKELAHEIHKDMENAIPPMWVYVNSEEFYEIEDDKGKPVVGISFEVSARWEELEITKTRQE